jgi:hypothetical protein
MPGQGFADDPHQIKLHLEGRDRCPTSSLIVSQSIASNAGAPAPRETSATLFAVDFYRSIRNIDI